MPRASRFPPLHMARRPRLVSHWVLFLAAAAAVIAAHATGAVGEGAAVDFGGAAADDGLTRVAEPAAAAAEVTTSGSIHTVGGVGHVAEPAVTPASGEDAVALAVAGTASDAGAKASAVRVLASCVYLCERRWCRVGGDHCNRVCAAPAAAARMTIGRLCVRRRRPRPRQRRKLQTS